MQAVSAYLQAEGWLIEQVANTEKRETGVDIRASGNGSLLPVEIKGYPSTVYQRGPNKGSTKRTKPGTQARHWYSEVLMCAILRQAGYPNATVVIALPDFIVFTNLVERTQSALNKPGIHVLFVQETGTIRTIAT